MKLFYLLITLCLLGCRGNTGEGNYGIVDATKDRVDPMTDAGSTEPGADLSSSLKTYSNARFRDVTVEKSDAKRFTVEGEAQVFEATVSWIVEDGHNELLKGFVTADTGAPEWGHFRFTIEVEAQRPSATLTLVLYETSMKDGSRQHELAIPLP